LFEPTTISRGSDNIFIPNPFLLLALKNRQRCEKGVKSVIELGIIKNFYSSSEDWCALLVLSL